MMGFVSYANLVGSEKLEETIQEIKENSHAKTKFEKAQEKAIVDQLRDPTFANLQTFCIMCRLDVGEGSDQTKFFSKPPEVSHEKIPFHITAGRPPAYIQLESSKCCGTAREKLLTLLFRA